MDVIFDIDGTLADLEHRRHFVRSKPKNWPAFNRGMAQDTPIEPTIAVLHALVAQGARVLVASGREGTDANREATVRWLFDNVGLWFEDDCQHLAPDQTKMDMTNGRNRRGQTLVRAEGLWMRDARDFRRDDEVKSDILDEMLAQGFNPTMVFDDRPQVVRMWRARGVFVFDVNQTGEEF